MVQMIQRHRKSNKANDISFLGEGAIFEGEPIYVRFAHCTYYY